MRLNQRAARSNFEFRWMPIAILAFTLVATGCSMKSLKGGLLKLGQNNTDTATAVWLDSFEEAKQVSAATGKPILADFTGTDWCVWCQRLRKEVFDRPEFLNWASENVVLLELDYPKHGRQAAAIKAQNAELVDRYGIDSYPTILFLDGVGNELGRTGYVQGGPDAWIPVANSLLSGSDR